MKRESWVIYVCCGCGEGIVDGKQKHQSGCRDRRYDELVVVAANEEQIQDHRNFKKKLKSKKKSNPFSAKLGG